MKKALEHYKKTIDLQKQQIDDLIEERDMLRRSIKQQTKALAELWDCYLTEVDNEIN